MAFTKHMWRITTHLREADNWTELRALFIAGVKVKMSHSPQAESQGGRPGKRSKRYFRKNKLKKTGN